MLNVLLILVVSAAMSAAQFALLADPAAPLDTAMTVGLVLADAVFAGFWLLRYRSGTARSQALYAVGAAALFALMFPLVRSIDANRLLWVMALVLYSGLYARPFLTGYLFLGAAAAVYAAAYRTEAFLLGGLLWTGARPLGRMWTEERDRLAPAFFVVGGMLLFALLLPVAYFCFQTTTQTLAKTSAMPEVRSALWLTLWTATASVLAVTAAGVPLAYVLVRSDFPGKAVLNALVDLPLLIPPPVAGLALIALLGPKTPLGGWIEGRTGTPIIGGLAGIVAVQVFVGAPFLVRSAMIAFAGVDAHYERVARTLGAGAAGAFFRVTLPLAAPGILLGAVLMWFRAAGEFGATYLITQTPSTAPILVWKKFHEVGPSESHPIAILMVAAFLGLFAGLTALRNLAARRTGEG